MTVGRLTGMLKCKVLHTHMIRVLKQKERIPNVVRWLGSPIHKYGGLLEVVVLVVSLSICLLVSSDDFPNKREWDQLIGTKSAALYTATRLTTSSHLYTSLSCATCQPDVNVPLCWK